MCESLSCVRQDKKKIIIIRDEKFQEIQEWKIATGNDGIKVGGKWSDCKGIIKILGIRFGFELDWILCWIGILSG